MFDGVELAWALAGEIDAGVSVLRPSTPDSIVPFLFSLVFIMTLGLGMFDAPLEAISVRSSDVVKAVCESESEPPLLLTVCELELSCSPESI